MSQLVYSRLESTIAAQNSLLQQLSTSSLLVHLDALYTHVLSTSFKGEEERAENLLGTIALLNEPTTPALLATLLEMSPQEVTMLLQAFVDERFLTIESPLDPLTDTTTLRLCHDSLRAFVSDSLRCRITHSQLFDRCLLLLNEKLRQDICDIRDQGLSNAEIPDLQARIARSVPEALRYACLSWPTHLCDSGSVSETGTAALLDFCTHHLLHWLELLSLLGGLFYAHGHLHRSIAWCQVSVSPAS
jgi:hypothetical protein